MPYIFLPWSWEFESGFKPISAKRCCKKKELIMNGLRHPVSMYLIYS